MSDNVTRKDVEKLIRGLRAMLDEGAELSFDAPYATHRFRASGDIVYFQRGGRKAGWAPWLGAEIPPPNKLIGWRPARDPFMEPKVGDKFKDSSGDTREVLAVAGQWTVVNDSSGKNGAAPRSYRLRDLIDYWTVLDRADG